MAETHVCNGRPDPEVSRQHRAEILDRRSRLWSALEAGPGTAAEIRDRMGEHAWRCPLHYGAGCRGHLGERVYVTRFGQADVQRDLVRLEKLGIVDRLILPGVQAHLWWLVARSASVPPPEGQR